MLISTSRWIFFTLLLLPSSFTCVTSQKLATDCFDKEILPQPISIHMGGDTITVAYAHSFSNVSTLAAAHYRSTNFPGLAGFGEHISRLRLEYFRQSVVSELQFEEKLARRPFHQIWQISRGYLVTFYKCWKELCDELDSTFIRWIDLWLDDVRRIFHNITIFTPIPEPRVDIGFGPLELENSMRRAFLLIKELTRNNTGIEIRSAVIVRPDFFNTTTNEVMTRAVVAAGIEPQLLIDRKTAVQSYDNPPQVTKSFRSLFSGFRYDPRLNHIMDTLNERQQSNCQVFFMIDYGESYLDIHIKGCPCQYNRALDHLGFYRITEEVIMKYILKDNAPLKQELQHGGLYNQLVYSVHVARHLIHYSCAGTNATDDDQHCEEWPLALSYELRTDERINTVLYWDDLQAVENEYAQLIEQRVAAAVELLEEAQCDIDFSLGSFRDRLDKVYIIGSYSDGELIRRAVQDAMGRDVKIKGGDQDGVLLASIGGARFALANHEMQDQIFESFCLDKRHDEL